MTFEYDSPHDKLYDLMVKIGKDVSDWPHPHWFRCPSCMGLGTIDREQYEGKISIVCSCGWHGYRRNGQKVGA